jgi:hypothetical protein
LLHAASSPLPPICLSRRRHPSRSLLTGSTDTIEFESCAIWTGQRLEPWMTPSGLTNGVRGIRDTVGVFDGDVVDPQ